MRLFPTLKLLRYRPISLPLVAAVAFLLPQYPARADALPLEKGVYVAADTPCAKVSYGTVSNYDGKAIHSGHFTCTMRVLGQTGDTWRIEQSCENMRGDTSKGPATVQITSRTSFVFKNQHGTFPSRLCRPNEMPKPFGSR